MRFLSAFLLSVVLPALPAGAGETAWQEVAPGVSVRLISEGAVDAAGHTTVALEIDMPENTKTYWRVPGETGLPTELDFSRSSGIAGHTQHWPLPQRDDQGGFLDYVYYGHTLLPVELSLTGPAGVVRLAATFGVCSEICVPAHVELELPLSDTRRDIANGLRIDQALAEVPVTWEATPEPVGTVRHDPGASAIVVELDSTLVDPDSLIVAGDIHDPLFGTPQKSPQDDLVLLPILGKTDNSMLDGMVVELSFMTPGGAFQISRTIEAGDQASVDGPGQ